MNHPKSKEILIVDDEVLILESIRTILTEEGFNSVVTCGSSPEALKVLKTREIDLVLLDLTMPEISGQELLEHIKEEYPSTAVIIVTGINDVGTAVECMRLGASDYLVKAIDKNSLLSSINRAFKIASLTEENIRLKTSILTGTIQNPEAFEEIITGDPGMEKLFLYLESIAPTACTLLVSGETGTGKELLAEAFHKLSRVPGKLIKLNIAGLDDTMFSDTLFGHKKGAFSGAFETRNGLIASAADGTLFLDEIGDLQPQSQTKLLRLVENREYYRLGSDLPLKANCNIIMATNKKPAELANSPGFRKDLYYRMSNYAVEVPPLRERRKDIRPLFFHYLAKTCGELRKPLPAIPEKLLKELQYYDFPGNVRELMTLTKRAGEYSSGGELLFKTWKDIPGITLSASNIPEKTAIEFPHPLPGLKETTDALIEEALARSSGNITRAAGLLGISQPALSKRLSGRE